MKKLFVLLMIVTLMLLFGCATLQPAPEKIHFKQVLLSDVRPASYGQYQPQSTFHHYDTIWLYVEFDGFEKHEVEGRIFVSLRATMVIRYPTGQEATTILFDNEAPMPPGFDFEKSYFAYPIPVPPSVKPDEYEMVITITDKYSGHTASKTIKLVIERAGKIA